jgi:hypothetical protein
MSHGHGLAWWVLSSISFRFQHTPAILVEFTHLAAAPLHAESYQQNLFANLCITIQQDRQALDTSVVFTATSKLGKRGA